jgi:ubiquinol-cytochrome c reductase iron-sulfur subunit
VTRRSELAACVLLLCAAAAAVGFVAAYVLTSSTPLLGACLGAALLSLAAALITAGKRVVVRQTVIEPRPQRGSAESRAEVRQTLAEAGEGISRRRLILAAGGTAGVALTAAAVTPLASLGPSDAAAGESPWRDGTALVDDSGDPVRSDAVALGSFVTAFPAGADPRELGSPVILVRLPADSLRMPAARRDWTPQGLVAYSKICTHAGCAVSMLRYPLYAAHSPAPAVVCPCHYSTFDVGDGGTVLFGPAGRPLPQLPLRVRSDGTLEAAGPMSGPIGPGWWGVRRT